MRNTVPELSFKAVSLGLALFTSAIAPALADEPPCPDSTVATSAPLPAKSERPPTDAPITIESDDNNFEFDVKGNAKLCGHVVMRQGDRVIRADCLEYNAGSQSAKLTGGVEYSAHGDQRTVEQLKRFVAFAHAISNSNKPPVLHPRRTVVCVCVCGPIKLRQGPRARDGRRPDDPVVAPCTT